MAAIAVPPQASDTPGLRANRACRHCVQIKAKCIPLEGSNKTICQRCNRLGKECTTPAPVLRKRQRNKSTRVSQLEEKINTLTDLLTLGKGAGINSLPDPVTRVMTGDIRCGAGSSLLTPPVSTTQEGNYVDRRPLHEQSTTFPAPFCKLADTTGVEAHFPTTLAPALEERLFSDFQTEMIQHFPFVVVPPQATAATFRKEKAFLFRTCIAASCYADIALQRQLVEELMKYLGERLLLKAEKSLDLLQGLLIFIGWYQYYNHYNPQLMNLVHLATSMAIDLGLNRPYNPGMWPPIGTILDTAQVIHGKAVSQGCQTLDERRAILGLYYFTGHMSSSFRRLDPMRWTDHLEDCCNVLMAAAEYPSDALAVQLVQLVRIMERYSPYIGIKSSSNVPIRTFVRCFEGDLQRYRQTLPAGMSDNRVLGIHIRSAYICLYETVLTTEDDIAIHRAEALHTCLHQISKFYGSISEAPPKYFPRFPFLVWLNIFHSLIVLGKLSFMAGDGWDVEYVRASGTNFAATVDRLIEKLEAVAQQSLEEIQRPGSNLVATRYGMYAEKMRLCKKWYEQRLRAEMEPQTAAPADVAAAWPTYDISMEGFFEGFDDGMWLDLTGDWTAQMQN